jgi:hypothetical protein
VGGDPALHYFQVLAHTEDPFVFWESNVVTGYSVDNLSPGAPLMLTAVRTDGDVLLEWSPSGENDEDLSEYAVYRADASGVEPLPAFYLSSTADTTLLDEGAPGTELYYVVTAVDVHGNEGMESNEAMVEGTSTGTEETVTLSRLRLGPNAPNPFSRTTLLALGLPSAAPVKLEVYDVLGRRVAHRDLGTLGTGWQEVRFEGRDDKGRPLSSGVYFYRVSAAGETLTRKMVIRR